MSDKAKDRGPKVILMSGKAQAGKDTSAQIIKDIAINNLGIPSDRILIIHFADPLKFVLKNYFGWDGIKDEYGRGLLQRVGTDIIRAKDEDFWANFTGSLINYLRDFWDLIIIPDARFPNEITVLADMGLDVTHIRIERNNEDNGLTESQKQHASETAMDSVPPEYIVDNNDTLDTLRENYMVLLNDMYMEVVSNE